MSVPTFSRFPFSHYPMNNISPVSYRDGYTFLERLTKLNSDYDELRESDNLQTDAISNFISDVDTTIREMMGQLVGYTIEVTDDVYTASMMDGGTFSAYTMNGVDNMLTLLENNLTNLVTTNTNQVNASLASTVGTLNTTLNTFRISVNASLDSKVSKSLIKNIRDYGAVGNGVVDDSNAIQAAIDAAAPGGHVYVPQGTYKITKTIELKPDTRLEGTTKGFGDNIPHTVIKATHNGMAVQMRYGSTLENIRIEGPGFQSSSSVGVNITGHGTIRNASVYNFSTGIYLRENWYTHLDHVKLYKNSIGLDVSYCYNLQAYNLQIIADRGDGSWANGIVLRDVSMMTMHGGSIESYFVGVEMGVGSTIACFGTYFESKVTGLNGRRAIGVNVTGQKSCVNLSGCQIYLTNHSSFVNFGAPNSGDTLIMQGNKFKGGTTGTTGLAVNWLETPSAALRISLLGDSFTDVKVNTYKYRPEHIPAGSIVMDPFNFEPARGGHNSIVLAGNVHTTGPIIMGSGGVLPPLGVYGNRGAIGAMYFSTTLNKPVFFNGTAWIDATGAQI